MGQEGISISAHTTVHNSPPALPLMQILITELNGSMVQSGRAKTLTYESSLHSCDHSYDTAVISIYSHSPDGEKFHLQIHTLLLNSIFKFCPLSHSNPVDTSQSISFYLFVLLHSGIQLLGEIIGDIGHTRLLLIATTQAALVFTCLLVILLFGIFAVSLTHLPEKSITLNL